MMKKDDNLVERITERVKNSLPKVKKELMSFSVKLKDEDGDIVINVGKDIQTELYTPVVVQQQDIIIELKSSVKLNKKLYDVIFSLHSTQQQKKEDKVREKLRNL